MSWPSNMPSTRVPRNKSWAAADRLVQRTLCSRFGKLQARSITRADIKATLSTIKAKTVVNQLLSNASAIFNFAIREEIGGVTVNPCRGIERNETTARERVLSDSEIRLFWNAFDDHGLLAGTALKIMLLTGQLKTEVLHLRREHIKDNFWEMPGKPVPEQNWPGLKKSLASGMALEAGARPPRRD